MRYHFIAIGGSAMHNLALALHQKGDTVTGSDDVIFEPSRSRLAEVGLLPENEGWFANTITKDIDAVILGMHAQIDNPELAKAQELGIPIYSYPEFLYKQAENKTRVVIGGSHGKTTITSMILHVMDYCGRDVDYMVGAQLEGFDTMVKITDDNDFMILEGDEYLCSPIDRRPKFHLYKPNIALLSGIAWDHINVFPTLEDYKKQFVIFVDTIVHGGILVYNEEDSEVKRIVEASENTIKRNAYSTPTYSVADGMTLLETPEGEVPVEIFGAHNMNNLAGAKWICQHMGIDEADFYDAIASFKGASKRLELIASKNNSLIFKDFAHSPSKVRATTNAVKQQYDDKKLIACLELHTYSSLNSDFIGEYEGALEVADKAIVFYSPQALAVKRLSNLSEGAIKKAFNRNDLKVFTEPKDFYQFLKLQNFNDSSLLLMSSGNYGGIEQEEFVKLLE